MRQYAERLVPPDDAPEEPVALEEAKLHVRQDLDADDELIEELIVAARERAEDLTERTLVPQTWELVLDSFPEEAELELPRHPLREVASIKYYDPAGGEHELAEASYLLDTASEPGRVVLAADASWPAIALRASEAVVVQYEAGYDDPAAIPRGIKVLIKGILAHWYKHREAVSETSLETVPQYLRELAWQYRARVPV